MLSSVGNLIAVRDSFWLNQRRKLSVDIADILQGILLVHFCMLFRVMDSNIEQPTNGSKNALHILDVVLMMQANRKLIFQLSNCIMNAGSIHAVTNRGKLSTNNDNNE